MTGDDRDDGLTMDERALARALSRVDAGSGPSAALDAAILASARGAAATPAGNTEATRAEAMAAAAADPTRADVAMATAAAASAAAGASPPAAHATGALPPSRDAARQRRRPNRRLATGLGIAASMVFAVGIAWQLRPSQDEQVVASEAPADDLPQRARIGAPRPEPLRRQMPHAQLDPPPSAAADDADAARSAALRDGEARADAAAPVPSSGAAPMETDASRANAGTGAAAPAEPPVVFDDPSPLDTPAPRAESAPVATAPAPPMAAPPPPPPAPPAPPAMAAPAPASAAASAAAKPQAFPGQPASAALAEGVAPEGQLRQLRTVGDSERRAQAQRARTSAQDQAEVKRETRAAPLDQAAVTGSRVQPATGRDAAIADGFHDEPLDDAPPATVDSPDVQQAWLGRIRELLADGQVDAARDSVAEFRRRYPDVALPPEIARAVE